MICKSLFGKQIFSITQTSPTHLKRAREELGIGNSHRMKEHICFQNNLKTEDGVGLWQTSQRENMDKQQLLVTSSFQIKLKPSKGISDCTNWIIICKLKDTAAAKKMGSFKNWL